MLNDLTQGLLLEFGFNGEAGKGYKCNDKITQASDCSAGSLSKAHKSYLSRKLPAFFGANSYGPLSDSDGEGGYGGAGGNSSSSSGSELKAMPTSSSSPIPSVRWEDWSGAALRKRLATWATTYGRKGVSAPR